MIITIQGRIPSKKNSRINTRSGRSFPSSKYTARHKEATAQLPKVWEKFNHGFGITLTFWLPDNRRTDLTNKAESVMDLLVDYGILEDDCWQITGPVHLNPAGVDKDNPRVIIEY